VQPERASVVAEVLREAESHQKPEEAGRKSSNRGRTLRIDHLGNDQDDRPDQEPGNSCQITGVSSPIAQRSSCHPTSRRRRIEALHGGGITDLAGTSAALDGRDEAESQKVAP